MNQKPFEYLDFPVESLPEIKADWQTKRQVMNLFKLKKIKSVDVLEKYGKVASQLYKGKLRYAVLENPTN